MVWKDFVFLHIAALIPWLPSKFLHDANIGDYFWQTLSQ